MAPVRKFPLPIAGSRTQGFCRRIRSHRAPGRRRTRPPRSACSTRRPTPAASHIVREANSVVPHLGFVIERPFVHAAHLLERERVVFERSKRVKKFVNPFVRVRREGNEPRCVRSSRSSGTGRERRSVVTGACRGELGDEMFEGREEGRIERRFQFVGRRVGVVSRRSPMRSSRACRTISSNASVEFAGRSTVSVSLLSKLPPAG